MEKFTQKYSQTVLAEMPKALKKKEPIRLMFSPGTETFFQATAIANQKGITPREAMEIAMRMLFLALNGISNEPTN